MVLVVTLYMRIRQKLKGLKEIDPSGWRKFIEIRRRSPRLSFLLIFKYLFFSFIALTVRISLFKRTGHTQTSDLIFTYINLLWD